MLNVKRLSRPKFVLLLAIFIFTITATLNTYAQSAQELWSEPVNLSSSGATSEPMLLPIGEVAWRALWIDRFDGLTSARETDIGWEAPVGLPLTISIIEGNGESIRVPVTETPDINADSQGNLHLLWLEPADSQIGLAVAAESETAEGDEPQTLESPQTTLFYSRASEEATWAEPVILARSVIDWQFVENATGQLYIFFLRTRQDESAPAGLYYVRSNNDGNDWSDAQLINANIYLRLLVAEDAHLQVATDDGTTLHVAWDDPHLQQSYYVRSADGGTTWSEPEPIGAVAEHGRRLQVDTGAAAEVVRLWDATPAGVIDCILYQQLSTDGGATWSERERVLDTLSTCPATWRFLRSSQGNIFWVGDEGSESVTIAAWDRTQWSAPKSLDVHFDELIDRAPINLTSLQMALLGETLGVVGLGEDDGEVWFLQSELSAFEWAFAPPPTWSEPISITSTDEIAASSSESSRFPGLPVIAGQNGVFHMVWSESPSLSQPSDTLNYATGSADEWARPAPLRFVSRPDTDRMIADEPALVALGEQLHLVWSGGDGGQILHSVTAADSVPARWSEPQPVSPGGVVACCSSLTADSQGVLDLVYAVPLNEDRGIYYTRSEDKGMTWSKPVLIFDAAAAGWQMVTQPRIAVDNQGHIHVAWLRGVAPGTQFGSTEGIYYAHSTDVGERWSEPTQLMLGLYEWPLLLTQGSGQLYLVGRDSSGSLEWFSRRSDDGGIGWSNAEPIPGFAGVSGPVSLATDGSQALYLLGLRQEGNKASQLLMSAWDGSGWSSPETQELNVGSQPGVAAALDGALGQLIVFFRRISDVAGVETTTLWSTNRAVPIVAITPGPTFTPQPTQTPVPTVQPTATATPRPDLGTIVPLAPSDSLTSSIPLILGAALATAIVGSIVVLRAARRP